MKTKYISKSKKYTGILIGDRVDGQCLLDKKSQEKLAKYNLRLVREQNTR
jgi:hypothetical protein